MWFALLLAALVGASLGLLGAGGSILALPILKYVAGFSTKQAVAASLATVGAVSLVGALLALKEARVRLRIAFEFAALASLGTFLGVRLALGLPDRFQMLLFVGVMLGAIRALGSAPADKPTQGRGLALGKGLGVGVLTGLVGVGGGFLIVPALASIYRLPMKVATGTSLWVIAINSFLGMLAYSQAVTLDWTFVGQFVAAALLGLLAGLRAGRQMAGEKVQRLFVLALVLVAVLILLQELAAGLS